DKELGQKRAVLSRYARDKCHFCHIVLHFLFSVFRPAKPSVVFVMQPAFSSSTLPPSVSPPVVPSNATRRISDCHTSHFSLPHVAFLIATRRFKIPTYGSGSETGVVHCKDTKKVFNFGVFLFYYSRRREILPFATKKALHLYSGHNAFIFFSQRRPKFISASGCREQASTSDSTLCSCG
ncbi:MAG: hypothetical protein II578_01555, partial [Bacteroidaceae bacterium]|nr:hypothetical protein [Bacteroidaceae bacterium]